MALRRKLLVPSVFLFILLCSSLIVSVKAEAITWIRTFEGGTDEWGYCVVETLDGGFAVAGTANHVDGDNDLWLVKTDKFGNMEWNQTYQANFIISEFSLIATSDGGYAIASHVFYSDSGIPLDCDFWLIKTDAYGNMEWSQTYGGPALEIAESLVEASDGGFVLVGSTRSFGAGEVDLWLVKTDELGNMEWNKTFGGTDFDWGFSLVATSDEGYAIGGLTRSFGFEDDHFWLIKTDANGNVEWDKFCGGTGVTGGDIGRTCSLVTMADGGYALVAKTYSEEIRWDFLLVKTDAYGNVEWNQTYGRGRTEWSKSMVASSDGGCVIAGFTNALPTAGSHDWWVVKTDALGNLEWDHTYGGSGYDVAESLVAVSDGGYAIAGVFGGGDFWLVKTDADGNMEWNQTYSETKIEFARSVVETSDGGYAVVGETSYVDSEEKDCWLMKTDGYGNVNWSFTEPGTGYGLIQTTNGDYAIAGHTGFGGANGADFWFWFVEDPKDLSLLYSRTYGGTETDIAYSLVEASDGGFAIVGFTESFGAGEADFWVVKTDELGSMEWDQTYGGAETEQARSVVATSDEGYAIAGFTESFGAGMSDFWLVKTDESGNVEWNKTYGGPEDDIAYSLVEASDGGYAMCGETSSFGAGAADFWLIKTDNLGNMVWNKTFGETSVDIAYSLVEASDGGFALVGCTTSIDTEYLSAGNTFVWLVKTDMFGNMEWNVTYGGESSNGGHSLVETSDGGFAIAGYDDFYGNGYYDFWLVKTDEFGNVPEAAWVVLPLLLTATLAIFISKKKLLRTRSQPS